MLAAVLCVFVEMLSAVFGILKCGERLRFEKLDDFVAAI
jgi:hypothetical protein